MGLLELMKPHAHTHEHHDLADLTAEGIKAVKVSLAALLVTALAQAGIVAISGSMALLADTIHNFSDALTSVPLWIAFYLAKRAGAKDFGRPERVAGWIIVAMIGLSAALAVWESIQRLIHPQPMTHLLWVGAAGVVGFLGNELVALYRIRVGRHIGSAALVADGLHARTDGITSLAVVLGAVATWLGAPILDPVIGLVIGLAIIWITVTAARGLRHPEDHHHDHPHDLDHLHAES
ncbi:MAG: cation diffusion facilitator family transporter [Propionibacteriaceae bacterium]|jgi:cation diffusion facilitator family transporter|nr:cation diffusion facilitator family transporter [Propionibacteriaceae bacterium]